MKPTPKILEGLRWFRDKGPCALFDASAPTRIIRKRLEAEGLIERAPSKGVFVAYQISDKGRKLLSEG